MGLGERCKLPQRGLERSGAPAEIEYDDDDDGAF